MDLDDVAGGDDLSDIVRMPDPNADKANAHRGKPLENLLMAKNRKLQDELTTMRVRRRPPRLSMMMMKSCSADAVLLISPQVAHEEIFAAHRTISADLDSLQSRFEEQRSLNERLENDLLRINQTGSSGGGPAAVREDPLASLNVGKKVRSRVKSSWMASTDASMQETAPAPAPFTSSAETSILPIITNQRDRFRQRNSELEEVNALGANGRGRTDRHARHAGTTTPV